MSIAWPLDKNCSSSQTEFDRKSSSALQLKLDWTPCSACHPASEASPRLRKIIIQQFDRAMLPQQPLSHSWTHFALYCISGAYCMSLQDKNHLQRQKVQTIWNFDVKAGKADFHLCFWAFFFPLEFNWWFEWMFIDQETTGHPEEITSKSRTLTLSAEISKRIWRVTTVKLYNIAYCNVNRNIVIHWVV